MIPSPELKLILCALQPEPENISRHITPNINWKLVYKLAIRHRVWHQVFAAVTSKAWDVPRPIYQRLANHCQQDKLRILAISAETICIARKFTALNIQHCFVKGIALNAHIYDELYTRPCNDIDVWADANTYQQATNLLLSLGYQRKLPSHELKGFQEQYYLNHKHDMAFYHPQRNILVELHFRLDYFGILFFPLTSKMFQKITLFNSHIMTLQDDYHLLYLMIHGAIHGWIRLRWLNDIALYLKSGKSDLKHVFELAKQIHCEHIVEQALLLVQCNFGTEDPTLAQLLIKPSPRGIKIARSAQGFIRSNYEQTEFRIRNGMFFKYRFYLIKLATTGQKINAIVSDLFKIDILFPHVSFSKRLSFMYYLLYPFWVIKFYILR